MQTHAISRTSKIMYTYTVFYTLECVSSLVIWRYNQTHFLCFIVFDNIYHFKQITKERATFEAALDWLCLNLRGNDLPLKFSSGTSQLNEGIEEKKLCLISRIGDSEEFCVWIKKIS